MPGPTAATRHIILDAQKGIAIKTLRDQYAGGKLRCQGKLFANGQWLGADIPEAKRKKEDVKTAPIIWEYLNQAGAEAWELVAVIESSAGKGQFVRTYYLKREAE